MAFGDLLGTHDPLLKSVAKEFLKIQADYEQNAKANKGSISEENLNRLRRLSAKLREPPETTSGS